MNSDEQGFFYSYLLREGLSSKLVFNQSQKKTKEEDNSMWKKKHNQRL